MPPSDAQSSDHADSHSRDSNPALAGGVAVQGLDGVDVSKLNDAISDASARHSFVEFGMKFPWELPGLDLVFGVSDATGMPCQNSVSNLPEVPVPVPCPTVSQANAEEPKLKKPRVRVDGQIFLRAVNFAETATDEQLEKRKWDRALEKWFVIISQNVSASLIGLDLQDKSMRESLELIRELFGKKSAATVLKRGYSLLKYMAWARSNLCLDSAFPFEGRLVDQYLSHLRRGNMPASALRSFQESVNFAVHVVGIGSDASRDLWSPWAKGVMSFMDLQRKARHPKIDLSLVQVKFLEGFLQDETNDAVDRYACGACLFALYSRSRSSDLRVCEDWQVDLSTEDPSVDGFIECTTRSHKAARQVARQAVCMPIVAPDRGVSDTSWAHVWCQVADSVGLSFKGRAKGPVLPAPNEDGSWAARSVSSVELCTWLKGILSKGGLDEAGVGSHSLKHTTLAWSSKFGMDKYARTLLGHHSTGKRSLEAYARDILAPALLDYCKMLGQVRKGLFMPDCSRSGRFVATGPAMPGPVNPSLGVSDNLTDVDPFEAPNANPDLEDSCEMPTTEASMLEQAWYCQEEAGSTFPIEQVEPAPKAAACQTSSSDSASDSSSEASSDGDELVAAPGFTADVQSAPWQPDVAFAIHKRSKTVHLVATGSSAEVFICGRRFTNDFERVDRTGFHEVRTCKQCQSSKPLKDKGSLISALDSLRSRET